MTGPHDDGETLHSIGESDVCAVCGSRNSVMTWHSDSMHANGTYLSHRTCYHPPHSGWSRDEYARRVSKMLATAPKSLPDPRDARIAELEAHEREVHAAFKAFGFAGPPYEYTGRLRDCVAAAVERIASLESELARCRSTLDTIRAAAGDTSTMGQFFATTVNALSAFDSAEAPAAPQPKPPSRGGEEPAVVRNLRVFAANEELSASGVALGIDRYSARKILAFIDRAPATSVPSEPEPPGHVAAWWRSKCRSVEQERETFRRERDLARARLEKEAVVLAEALRVAEIRRERMEKVEAELSATKAAAPDVRLARKAAIVLSTVERWVIDKRKAAEREGLTTPWRLAVEKELFDDIWDWQNCRLQSTPKEEPKQRQTMLEAIDEFQRACPDAFADFEPDGDEQPAVRPAWSKADERCPCGKPATRPDPRMGDGDVPLEFCDEHYEAEVARLREKFGDQPFAAEKPAEPDEQERRLRSISGFISTALAEPKNALESLDALADGLGQVVAYLRAEREERRARP